MSRPAPTPPHRPLDELWQPRALTGIVVAGEGLAVVLALAPGLTIDRQIYFGLASLWVQWISLASLATLFLARHWLNRLPPVQVGAAALVCALAYCWLITLLAQWYFAGTGDVDWRQLGLLASGITLTVGVLGLGTFDTYRRSRLLAVRTKHAELEALQARIRPHFLFNTLNTGAALVHAQPGQAERLLLDLAELFRAALAGPREIPLGEELELTRRYLEIEQLRFGSRLRVHWQVPTPLPSLLVPALSIQPLVENAIRHGVEPAADGSDLDLVVESGEREIRVLVRNALPPAGYIASGGHHVGLASARERIEAMTGGHGRLETRVEAGRYVATVHLPTGD